MTTKIQVSEQTAQKLKVIAKRDNKTIDDVILWVMDNAEKEAYKKGVTLLEYIRGLFDE